METAGTIDNPFATDTDSSVPSAADGQDDFVPTHTSEDDVLTPFAFSHDAPSQSMPLPTHIDLQVFQSQLYPCAATSSELSSRSSNTNTPLRLVKPDPSAFSFSGYQSKVRRSSISSSLNQNLPIPTPRTPTKRVSKKFVLPLAPTPRLSRPSCAQSSPAPAPKKNFKDDIPLPFSDGRMYEDSRMRRRVKPKSCQLSISDDFVSSTEGRSQILKKLKSLSKSPTQGAFHSSSHFPNTSPRSPEKMTERQRYTILSSSPVFESTMTLGCVACSTSPLSRKVITTPSAPILLSADYKEELMDDTIRKYMPITPSTSSPREGIFHQSVDGEIDALIHSPFSSDDRKSLSPTFSRRMQMASALPESGLQRMDESDEDSQEYQVVTLSTTGQYPWLTLYPHFLDRNYFDGLREENVLDSDNTADYFSECFEVIDVIGHGSFADVYKVVSRYDEQCYAIKRTRQPFSGLNDRSRKLEEVESMWKIGRHPHCLEVLNSWEQHGHLYILTEFCDGGSLSSLIEKTAIEGGRFHEDLMWNILLHVSLGLRHIHDQGMVHLDIKPANILIDKNGFLKIGDFGLTKVLGKHHGIDMEGDNVYMAPEVLEGSLDRSADVFSLGLILLELAANIELPSQGDPWQNLRNGHFDDIHLEQHMSQDLSRLIYAMLHPDPLKRPLMDAIITEAYSHAPKTDEMN